MATDLSKLDQYFMREPTKGQMAWGIIHDSENIILHYIQDFSVKVPQSFYDDLEKLTPDSSIQDLANLFYKIGLNPVWAVWWKKE